MVNYKPKCLAIPLIHAEIPEISTNETKYKQISCELFFYMRKIRTICPRWVPKISFSWKKKLYLLRDKIREVDNSKWRSKIILEMELSNTRGVANNSNFTVKESL